MTSKIVVNNIEADAGVSTVTFNSNVVRGDSNLHSTGLALGAGSTVGAVTGVTTYYGDGSQLTGISAGVSLANGVDNRVVTATGAAALNGESTLTYDNPTLEINTDSSYGTLKLDGDAGGLIEFKDDGTRKWELYGAANFSFYDRANTKYGLILKPGGDIEIPDGNLVIGSGPHGIDFSADSSGTLQALANSFNAEVLHDYEVGTFVPNIQYDTGTNQYTGSVGSGQSVSAAKGEYIRIGDMVWAAGEITLVANRNSTQSPHLSIGGMPYNGLHSSQQNSLMSGWGGAAWPKNDSNPSYRLIYSYHTYTTLNFRFTQTSGNNGIDGFKFHVYYRCPT